MIQLIQGNNLDDKCTICLRGIEEFTEIWCEEQEKQITYQSQIQLRNGLFSWFCPRKVVYNKLIYLKTQCGGILCNDCFEDEVRRAQTLKFKCSYCQRHHKFMRMKITKCQRCQSTQFYEFEHDLKICQQNLYIQQYQRRQQYKFRRTYQRRKRIHKCKYGV